MATIVRRDLYTLKVTTLDDGGVWIDVIDNEGLFANRAIVSAEGNNLTEAFADMAVRMARGAE